MNTYLQKPAHRKVTYHAWGTAYPTSDNIDYQLHRELDLVLATDRRLVTDVLSLQHLSFGKSNHFLQEIRLRADQLIVRRPPKAASRRIGAWAWRDESLASTCLASVMHATASYLATCPSHVHEYAPRNLETARFPVELEIFIDGSFTKGDDLPAGWGFTVVSPFPYGEATPTWDSIRGRLLFIVQRRYGPVTTDPQAFHYVGAHYQSANAGELTGFIEAQLWLLFEKPALIPDASSVEYVFDSLLAGNMTAGDWQPRTKADVASTLADLVETSNLLWRAQAPDHEAVYGRWIRGHSHVHPGFEFNHIWPT